MDLDQIKENWSNMPIIVRILFILLIIAFIYDIVTGQAFSIFFAVTLILLVIAEIYYWAVKKEK